MADTVHVQACQSNVQFPIPYFMGWVQCTFIDMCTYMNIMYTIYIPHSEQMQKLNKYMEHMPSMEEYQAMEMQVFD